MIDSARERRYLALILFAACFILSLFIGRIEYETLEGDVLGIALRPVGDILRDNYPDQSPLFFVLEHYWTKVFGVHELGTRLINVLISVVTVFYTWRVGRLMFGPRIGLLAAALLIITPAFYEHARYARMYALFVCASTAASYYALRYVEEKRPLDLLWWLLACLIGIYTHFFGFGTAGLTGLYMAVMVARRSPRSLGWVIGVGGALGALSLWQVLRMQRAMSLAEGKGSAFRMKAEVPGFFSEVNSNLFFKGIGFGPYDLLAFIALVFFLAMTVYGLRTAARRFVLFGALYLFLSQVTLFVVAMKADVRPRYFAFLAPIYIVFIVAGLDQQRESASSRARQLGQAALALMLGMFLSAVVAQNLRKPMGYVQAMAYVQSIYQEGDLLAAQPRWHHPLVQLRTPVPVVAAADYSVVVANAEGRKRIILIMLGAEGRAPKMMSWLNANATLAEQRNFNSVRVMVWSLEPESSPALRQLQARLEEPSDAVHLLVGGTVGAGARPLKGTGALEATLRAPVPLLASVDAPSRTDRQQAAMLEVGVDFIALPRPDMLERYRSDGVTPLAWPADRAWVGAPAPTSTTGGAMLLPVDLSRLSVGGTTPAPLPAEVSAAVTTARAQGPVVAMVRWPESAGNGLSAEVTRLAEALADTGVAAVVGIGTSAPGPVWRRGQTVIAPWPGMLLRAPRKNIPAQSAPDGLVLHLKVGMDGSVDAASMPIVATERGLEPAASAMRLFPDESAPVADAFDFRAQLPAAVIAFPADPGLTAKAAGGGENGSAVHRWGDGELKSIGWVTERSDGELRRGIRAPLPPGRSLELSYQAIPLGAELRGFLGLPDSVFGKGKRKAPISLEARIDGKPVGRIESGREPGWRHFRFDTRAWKGKQATVTFAIEGDSGLPLVFSALTANPPDAGTLAEAPYRAVSPQLVAWRESIRKLEQSSRADSAARRTPAPAMSTSGTEVRVGDIHYRLPKGIPTMGGMGVLADARWEQAKRSAEAPLTPLPPTPAGSYRLWEHLADAVVEVLPYEGGRELCTGWAETPMYLKNEEFGPNGEGQLLGRWRCGREPWKSVAQSRQKAGGDLRDALWVHPRDNAVVQVTFPLVPLLDRLEGYYGLTDLAAKKNDFTVYVEVLVGGRTALRAQIADEEGWKPFSVDTSAWKGQTADVTIRVETDKQRWRHFLIDAMTKQAG